MIFVTTLFLKWNKKENIKYSCKSNSNDWFFFWALLFQICKPAWWYMLHAWKTYYLLWALVQSLWMPPDAKVLLHSSRFPKALPLSLTKLCHSFHWVPIGINKANMCKAPGRVSCTWHSAAWHHSTVTTLDAAPLRGRQPISAAACRPPSLGLVLC